MDGQHAVISDECSATFMKQDRLVANTPELRRYGSYTGEISPAPDNIVIVIFGPLRQARNGLSSAGRLARALMWTS